MTSLRVEVRGQNDNFLDEVRVSRTFGAAAVPEPGGALLMVIGLVAG
jgi:hypothetical protein